MRVSIPAVLFTLFASTAFAQTPSLLCGTSHQQLQGCVEHVNGQSTFSAPRMAHNAFEPTVIFGWTVSLWSHQQPAALAVYYAGADNTVKLLPREAYDLHLRLPRPDVSAEVNRQLAGRPDFIPLVTDNWGYLVVIKAGALPVEGGPLALIWTDPSGTQVQVGGNFQQLTLRP